MRKHMFHIDEHHIDARMFHVSGSKVGAFAKSTKCADNFTICFQGYSAQFALGTPVYKIPLLEKRKEYCWAMS